MHDLGSLVYLDLHKTGSSFVSKFLNETCRLHTIENSKHKPIGNNFNCNSFYFITIRHPESMYKSLFKYGLDGNGGFYEHLKLKGYSHFYKKDNVNFNDWMRFVLDVNNRKLLGEGFHNLNENASIGFMSFRFFNLAVNNSFDKIASIRNEDDFYNAFKKFNILNLVIKNEKLNEGLLQLSESIKPDFFDSNKVSNFFNKNEGLRVNSSSELNVDISFDEDVLLLLKKREALLYKFYESSSNGIKTI